MISIILVILIVISFALGLTAFLWKQMAVAIAFSIILPIMFLFYLVSPRYNKSNKNKKRKAPKDPVDNYFHPMEK